MRIAVYHNLTSGGAKRALYEKVKRLAARHTIDVHSLSTADHEFADIRPFVANHHVYPFRPIPLLKSPFGRLNQVIRLLDLRRLNRLTSSIAARIEAGDYNLVYVDTCQFENCPGLLRHLHNLSSVYYCHEPLRIVYETMPARPYDERASTRRRFFNRFDPLPGLYKRALQINDRANMRRASRVLVNSKFTRENVKSIYQVEARVNYQGVDANHFQSLELERQRFVLSVGSLTPLKGFDFLIQSLAEIPPRERPALVIASNFQNPPEKAYLQGLAQEKSVDLRLLGNVNEESLVELYNQAFLTAYAPIREPLGFVSLESMACETPVVAVREGGIPETVLHNRTGLVVERDPKEFAQALCSLLANPAKARQLGKAGRAFVLDQWTWDHSVVDLEGHFSFTN